VDVRREGQHVAEARLAPRPAWYDRRTPSGRPMHRIATMQGTVLAVYAGSVCEFWVRSEHRPARETRFCSVGLNPAPTTTPPRPRKRSSPPSTRPGANTPSRTWTSTAATPTTPSTSTASCPSWRASNARPASSSASRRPPPRSRALGRPARGRRQPRVVLLRAVRPRTLPRGVPRQTPRVRQRAYLDAVETCVAVGREGPAASRGSSTASGRRPRAPAATIAGIDWLVARGAVPTVCSSVRSSAPTSPTSRRRDPRRSAWSSPRSTNAASRRASPSAPHTTCGRAVLLAESAATSWTTPRSGGGSGPPNAASRSGAACAPPWRRRVASAALRAPRGPRTRAPDRS
jgi:hypothetical protein